MSLNMSIVVSYQFNKTAGFHDVPKDFSGNELNLQRPPYQGGFSTPKWVAEGGISGSGYRFYGNSSQSQFFYREGIEKILSNSVGTISVWIQPLGTGNLKQCILSLSNGFVPLKTEFLLEANYDKKYFNASLVKDGVSLWSISALGSPLMDSVGLWTHLCIVQDGVRPGLFINGNRANILLKSKDNAFNWFSGLLSANDKPTKLCIGATPRNYAPFMTLGLFALLDEITIWDSILSEQEIKDLYESKTINSL